RAGERHPPQTPDPPQPKSSSSGSVVCSAGCRSCAGGREPGRSGNQPGCGHPDAPCSRRLAGNCGVGGYADTDSNGNAQAETNAHKDAHTLDAATILFNGWPLLELDAATGASEFCRY